MSADEELERLKAKRLEEMRMRAGAARAGAPGPKKARDPREILAGRLGYRGEEVLRNAEAQFPKETRAVVSKLASIIESGELPDVIDGGSLLSLFRSIGLSVRMQTRITVEQDGKMVSLSDRLSGRKSGERR